MVQGINEYDLMDILIDDIQDSDSEIKAKELIEKFINNTAKTPELISSLKAICEKLDHELFASDLIEKLQKIRDDYANCICETCLEKNYNEKIKSKSILSISHDDIRLQAKDLKVSISEEQIQDIFDEFDVNDVMMEGFWELLKQMIEEKGLEIAN